MLGHYRPAYLLFLGLIAFAIAVSIVVGDDPFSKYVTVSLTGNRFLVWILAPLLWLLIVAAKITLRRIDRPTATLLRQTRRHKWWLIRGAVLIAATVPFAQAVTTVKTSIPKLQSFYADPFLAGIDRAIFGTDPWRMTHAMIGPFGTYLIDRAYAVWFLVLMALIAWLAFTPNLRVQARGILALALSWILLGAVSIGLASVGPCFYQEFYGSNRYEPLMELLWGMDKDYNLRALLAMKYLLATHGEVAVGNGISAMPSLHVAMAFLFWLVVRETTRKRWASIAAFAYFLLIQLGSVHLGWHYASDGFVSIIVVALVWWSTGRFVGWLEQNSAPETYSDRAFAVA